MSDLADRLNKKYAVLNSQCKVKSLETNLDLFISNVVCSYSTRCHLNLKRIAMEGLHVEYKRENNMVNMRLRKPLSTATIWSSGKITCTGATTELDAYKAARRFCRLLQKMKFKVRLSNYRVVNVLASCSMAFDIDLNKVANEFRQECSYEPELHPGATFRIKQYRCTLKLFTTGSITLTAPSVLFAQKSIDFIYPILCKFKRQHTQFDEKPNVQSQPIHLNTTTHHQAAVPQLQPPQSYLITTPLNTVNGPTVINLNKADYITSSSSSSLSNDSFTNQSQQTAAAFNLNQAPSSHSYYTSHNFSHFTHPHHHHNHFFNDNLIIDNVYEDFLQ